MSFEETFRMIVREELDRREERIAERVAARIQSLVTKSDDRLIGPDDDLSGYSWETVKRWIRDGHLKRYGTTKRVRVSERELRAFLASRNGTGAEPTDSDILDLARERAARR